jgi:hypothetical protein
LGQFWHGKKSFVKVKIIFFRSKFGKISPKEKKNPGHTGEKLTTRGISQFWLQVTGQHRIFLKSLAIFWRPTGTYLSKHGDFRFFPQILVTLVSF